MPRKPPTVAAYRYLQKASNAPPQETATHETGPVPTLIAPPSDRGPREPLLWWRTREPLHFHLCALLISGPKR